MAANTKNKYPADKSGTKYAEFRNTRRVSAGKTTTTTRPAEREARPAGDATAQNGGARTA
jgi:hypothetical protein